MPGNIAGPLRHKGHKCGTWSSSLVLGVWLTTHPVNPKMRPRKDWISWTIPQQLKRLNELTIDTWNVWTLHRPSAFNELMQELKKYNIYICELEEIMWFREGVLNMKDGVFL